jgi:hypothetical protein
MAHRQDRSPIVWIQENNRLGHRWHSVPAAPFISRGSNAAVLGEIENIPQRSLGSAWADADTAVMCPLTRLQSSKCFGRVSGLTSESRSEMAGTAEPRERRDLVNGQSGLIEK